MSNTVNAILARVVDGTIEKQDARDALVAVRDVSMPAFNYDNRRFLDDVERGIALLDHVLKQEQSE